MRGQSLSLSLVWACSLATLAGAEVKLTTQGPYELPLTETRLCVIAIHSPLNNVELKLANPHNGKSVTISLAMTKYGNQSQVSAAGLGDNVAIVSRDLLNLKTQLISIFRKDNVLAVYRAGQVKPVLVYQSKSPEKMDFVDFTTLYMSGPNEGYTVHIFDLDKRGYGKALAQPHGKAVSNELNAIQKVVKTRLSFLDIIIKHNLLNSMSMQDLREINELVEAMVLRQLFVLEYYGIKLQGNYAKVQQTLVSTVMPIMRQKLKIQ